MKSQEERSVRRRSRGRDEGRGRDRDSRRSRGRDEGRGRDRARDSDSRRELEREEEERRGREKGKRGESERLEDDEKKRIQEEDESMRVKREKRARRWDQPPEGHDHGKRNTSAPLACEMDAPTAQPRAPQPSIQAAEQPTKCLVLRNVFDPEFASKEGSSYCKRIRDCFHQKCGSYGAVHHIETDENHGSLYMKFDTSRSASIAQKNLHEKSFKERVITASFMDIRTYDSRFGTLRR